MDRNAPMKITQLRLLDFIAKKSASVKDTPLQGPRLSCKSYNPNEITNYFVCTAAAHAWMSCILC